VRSTAAAIPNAATIERFGNRFWEDVNFSMTNLSFRSNSSGPERTGMELVATPNCLVQKKISALSEAPIPERKPAPALTFRWHFTRQMSSSGHLKYRRKASSGGRGNPNDWKRPRFSAIYAQSRMTEFAR
jgi:hypothetical protein